MSDKDILKAALVQGKDFARKIAEELISVQPMSPDIMRKLHENSMTTEELIADGYRPVSSLGLMWVKDDDDVGPST